MIDPVQNRTAALADRHLRHQSRQRSRAGARHDARHHRRKTRRRRLRRALHQRLRRARANWRAGYDSRRACPRSPASPPKTSSQLAREYATTRPAVIRLNYGVQRSERGGAAVRAIAALPALTGAWKEVGGGVQLSTSQAFQFNRAGLEMPELQWRSPLGREARIVNMSRAGRGARPNSTTPPVKAMVVYNSNPAAIAPESERSPARACAARICSPWCSNRFQTDTADYADIVLPATTFLEHTDLYCAYGHYYLQLARPALPAPGEARSNVEVFRDLAARMGFDDPCFRDSEDDMIRTRCCAPGIRSSKASRSNGWSGSTRPLEHRGARHAVPALRGRRVRHAVGQMRIRRRSAGATRRRSNRASETFPCARVIPLELISSKNDDSMNSTFGNRPGVDADTALLHLSGPTRKLAASRPAIACASSTIAAVCCCAPMSMAWCSPESPAFPPCAGTNAPRTVSASTYSPPNASPTWAAAPRSTVAWYKSSVVAD